MVVQNADLKKKSQHKTIRRGRRRGSGRQAQKHHSKGVGRKSQGLDQPLLVVSWWASRSTGCVVAGGCGGGRRGHTLGVVPELRLANEENAPEDGPDPANEEEKGKSELQQPDPKVDTERGNHRLAFRVWVGAAAQGKEARNDRAKARNDKVHDAQNNRHSRMHCNSQFKQRGTKQGRDVGREITTFTVWW